MPTIIERIAAAGLALAAAMAEKEASGEAERLLVKSAEEAEALITGASARLPEAEEAIVNYILKEF